MPSRRDRPLTLFNRCRNCVAPHVRHAHSSSISRRMRLSGDQPWVSAYATLMAENTLNTKLDIDHAFQAWSDKLSLRLVQIGICRI